MSTADLLGTLAPEFDAPVAPRAEFVDGLWARIELEIRPRTVDRPVPRRNWLVPLLRSPRRLAAVVAVVLLLLSGVATATYLGVRTWVSSSPRGVQVTSDFQLSRVVRLPSSSGWVWATALSADGHDLYLSRGTPGPIGWEILRVRGVDSPHPSPPRRVLALETVADPAFNGGPAWQGLATGPSKDIFVLSGGWGGSQPATASLLVVRPDGSRQTVVTYRELRKRKLVPGVVQGPDGVRMRTASEASFAVAVVAANRVWLLGRLARHSQPASGSPYDVRNYLFEVTDPTADGDWSDRAVRRIDVPRTLPGFSARRTIDWWVSQPVVEPPLPGPGHATSVLLNADRLEDQRTGAPLAVHRVYRLRDLNDDGDVLDRAETELVRVGSLYGAIASRVDRSFAPARRQLVLAGVESADRISLVAGDGAVTDIGRSFPGTFRGVLTGPRGDIFAVVEDDQSVTSVYRLAPGRSAAAPAAARTPQALRVPSAESLLFSRGSEAYSGTKPAFSYWKRPDGTRASAIARHVGAVCQSSDGSRLAFTSDVEVPREPFVYVQDVAGDRLRKVTERAATPVCPFDGRHIVLAEATQLGYGPIWTLDAYDVKTHREQRLVTGSPRFSVSPDGTRIAYVDRGARGDSLVVVDVPTLERRRVAGPLAHTELSPGALWYTNAGGDLEWSPDGTRVAFVTGRSFTAQELAVLDRSLFVPKHRYAVHVADLVGHTPRRVITVRGGPPTVSWSPDGARLLVCAGAHGPSAGCRGRLNVSIMGDENPSILHVVAATGPASDHVFARGTILFVGWEPRGHGFAWADSAALHFSDGRNLRVYSYGGEWVGWSPDGRFIVQGPENDYAVIDVVTGKRQRVIRTQDAFDVVARWWQP
jgi:hypothetical protein